MSRFFATGSDSESDSASEEEQVQRAPATAFTVCNIFKTDTENSLYTFFTPDILLIYIVQ
jgi:hypothetical protein